MKKLVLFIAMLSFAAFSFAQTIENFESLTMNLFSGGTNGALDVIANPDMNGNETMYVGQMDRGFDGDPWAGWYADLDEAITVNAGTNQYIHVKLWKPRVSPIVFKLENPGTGANSGDVNPMAAQALTDEWEEFVFDFGATPGDYTRIVLIPDFEIPLTLTEDITLYFDEMYVNDDPTPGSEPVIVFEDFEPIQMNIFSAGANGAVEVVANPDPEGNSSLRVGKMTRGADGDPWAGWWADLSAPIDVAATPFVTLKLWKPRTSPIVFKYENPGAGTTTGDVNPIGGQTIENGWEELVFDFSAVPGEYTRIVLIPDFETPLTLTEDIVIYFDDITASATGPVSGNVTFNVNMADAIGYNSEIVFDPELHNVYISGDFAGWPQPGTDPSLMFTTTDNENYTLTMAIDDGPIMFKYFFAETGGSSWDNGEWSGDPNRQYVVAGETTFNHMWGDKPFQVTFNVDMENADPFDPATDDIYIAGDLANGWAQPGTIEFYKLNAPEDKSLNYWITLTLAPGDYQYKYFRIINGEPSWDNGEWSGDPNRMVTVDTTKSVNDIWGSPAAIFEYQPVTFNMYPNPAGNQLTVDKLEAATMIEVYNVVGEKVISVTNIQSDRVILNTANLTEGIYLITVYTEKGVQSTKFLKK